MDKKFWESVATLSGTVIGAGVLGLPYVVSQSGWKIGFAYMIGLGFVFLIMNLMVGEFILRTRGIHQMTGYAEKYLGKYGKNFMVFAMMMSIYGAMTGYTIGVGNTVNSLFNQFSPFVYSIVFFFLMAGIIYKGLNVIEEWEVVLGIIMGLIAKGKTIVDDADCINTSFPNFIEILERITPKGTIRIEK